MKKFLTIITLIALLVPSVAFAEGFGVYEWSATGTGMGDNFMFDEEDAAVLAYNPAGITHLKGKNLSFNAAWFNPAIKGHFNNTPGGLNNANGYFGTTHRNNSYDPVWAGSAFYTHQLSDKYWLGLGIFPRFGNGISFPSGWEGRYDTLFSKITGISIQPTVAYKPHKKWSVAAGIDINYVKLQMDKALPVVAPAPYGYMGDSFFSLEGTTTKVGWFVSAMYDFDKKNSAAMTYRSKIKHNMDADTSASGVGPGPFSGTNTKSHGSVTLPESVSVGFGHKFNDRTRIEFDAIWTNWTSYDALNLSFDDSIFGQYTSDNPKDWNAVWRFGIGLQHRMSDKWTFLCGYNFDASPVPDKYFDFTVPTGDRHRGSIGFKYNVTKDAAISFAYTAIWAASRDVYSKAQGMDYTSAHINDCLTQILSLGFTMKLK